MKNISLTLTGFRGIRDGLGRDSIHLDFEQLVGSAQLVAIKGPNGRGKSTILDNMHPYPVMPSRAGAEGLGKFSFYDQVVLPESSKENVWEHGGRRYRTQMVFRVNGKKKTEAYLHVLAGDRWEPARTASGIVSDGKVETYRLCVEDVLGSQETFFTSAFSSQNKRPLIALANGEIKSLWADLLGYEEIRRVGAQAADVVKLLKVGLAGIRQEFAGLQGEEGQAVVKRAALGDPKQRIDDAEAARQRASASLDEAKSTLVKVRAAAEAGAQVEARRAQMTAEQRRLVEEGRTVLERIDRQIDLETKRGSDLERRIARRIQEAKNRRQALQGQQARLLKVVEATPRLRLAERRLDLARRVVGLRSERLERLRDAVEKMVALQAAEAASAKELAAIEREAGQAALSAQELAKRFGLTAEVPCAGSDLQGRCKLLADAREAKTLMPSAELEITRLNGKKTREEEHRNDIRIEMAELLSSLSLASAAAAKVALGAAGARLETARARASAIAILAARRGEVEQARVSLDAVMAELQALGAGDVGESAEEAAERKIITEASEVLSNQRKAEAVNYRSRYDELGRQLAALPAPAEAGAIQAAERAVAAAQAAATAADGAYLNAVRDQEAAVGLDSRVAEIRARLSTVQGRTDNVEDKLRKWNLFARCMSNDGVIALLIDDAGPTLAALANDLLLACHGPRFTVSIETQIRTDKGEAREGFDIVVFDAESGSSKSVRDMSGGQRVWINECMVRAIALYLAQNSGRRYETLFCDEADGPLDPEHKRMFMAMKREVLRIGGYAQEFFISQTPELTAMADAVIDLDQFAVSTEDAL